MTMKCKECKKEYDVQDNYIIYKKCGTMFFVNKKAAQEYFEHAHRTMCEFQEKSHKLNQKKLNDPVFVTKSEEEILEMERDFNSFRVEFEFSLQNNEWLRNTNVAKSIYKFNENFHALVEFYSKYDEEEDG